MEGKVAVSFHGEAGSQNKKHDMEELVVLKGDAEVDSKGNLRETYHGGWFDASYSDFETKISSDDTGYSSLSDYTGRSFQYLIYTSKIDIPTLWVPDSPTDEYNTFDNAENQYIWSKTSYPAFLIPRDGMEIPSTAKGAKVALILNAKDLIEVYDIGGGVTGPSWLTNSVSDSVWKWSIFISRQ